MDSIAFIGGGNMAKAIVGGLVASGRPAHTITVVDPDAQQRQRMTDAFGVATRAAADASLSGAATVVWAVKPQYFRAASAPCATLLRDALHVSVMAGIRSGSIAAALGAERVVRAMPNTPALIGQGITGLYAREATGPADRADAQALIAPTGQWLWVAQEADLDAVTALSGSGPAYVFYFLEAMEQAACDMGLSRADGRQLALATFAGATALAQSSELSVQALREQVTSRGGTTQAAITALDGSDTRRAFIDAIRQAQRRARELGDEFAA